MLPSNSIYIRGQGQGPRGHGSCPRVGNIGYLLFWKCCLYAIDIVTCTTYNIMNDYIINNLNVYFKHFQPVSILIFVSIPEIWEYTHNNYIWCKFNPPKILLTHSAFIFKRIWQIWWNIHTYVCIFNHLHQRCFLGCSGM